MTASTITHLGNPVPHVPINKDGEMVGSRLADVGPSVSEAHWQPEISDALIAHVDAVRVAIELEGLERFHVRTLKAVLMGEHAEDWELAAGHVYYAVEGHARAGASWVATEHIELEEALSLILGAERAPVGTSAALKLARFDAEGTDEILAGLRGPTNLKMETGVELIAQNSFGEAAQVPAAQWVGITANSEAPAHTNTALAGEVTTAGGGLVRKKATIVFTKATGVQTVTVTITANSTDALPLKAEKFGVFNKAKASEGTNVMVIETKLSSSVEYKAELDNMTLTDTLTYT